MSEEKLERQSMERHEVPLQCGDDFPEGGSSVPMKMQMFSTWEVRKVPANCVSRLCVLTVTRLQVVRPLESGHGSIVLSASMKTPHRVLRSNEISLTPNALFTISLELTYSLQYPHFLKRGGNVLQIRLQRRKRVGNHPLGGYKTLAMGKVDMSQVLQHSYQGEVKLYSEKFPEHVATVTVGSLTSITADLERRSTLIEVSSEEDEDDIFSDDLVERVSDSESGGEEQSFGDRVVVKEKKFMPSTAALLKLLRLSRPPKSGHHHCAVGQLLEEAGEVEFRESSVTFASSLSDSDEELEEDMSKTPPRPTLSPFFGSGRCSLVSLPTSTNSAESMVKLEEQSKNEATQTLKKSSSLEQAILTQGIDCVADDDYEWDLAHGRLWCTVKGIAGSQAITQGLEREQEVVTMVEGDKDTVQKLISLMNAVHKQWRDRQPFMIVLVGSDTLVSNALQALVAARCSPHFLQFAIIPITAGLMSARLASIDQSYRDAFLPDGPWIENLKDGVDNLLQYIGSAKYSLPLPLAQTIIQRPLKELGAYDELFVPFVCSMSIGGWESDPTSDTTLSTTPNLPLSPPPVISVGDSSPEILLEYWSPKGQKSHQGSVKVRSLIVSCANSVLNVTATKDKKVKGIRIRKSKDSESGGSIVSLTATQLVCRPVTKTECVSVVVDGVERENVSLVRLSATWEQTHNRIFSIAVTSALVSST